MPSTENQKDLPKKKDKKYTKKDYMKIPMPLLKGLLDNPGQVMNDWVLYCLFGYAQEIMGESGFSPEGFKKAIKFYNLLNYRDLIIVDYDQAYLLHNSIELNELTVGLKWSTFWASFRRKDVEYDLVSLLAFMAIKNIIFKQIMVKTNKQLIFSRMDGYRKSIKKEQLSPSLCKYFTRYKFDKIKQELSNNWNVSFYGYKIRGFWVSIELKKEVLIKKVEELKTKSDKDYRQDYYDSLN